MTKRTLFLATLCALPLSAAPWTGRIVFSSDRSGPWRIWVINGDGSGPQQLTTRDTDDHDVDPVYSPPDGKSILFTSTRGATTGVWRMRSDGSMPERVCEGDQAEWSPDGLSIVLRRDGRILTHRLDNGSERAVSPADWPRCSAPAWSPDGKHIAFAALKKIGNAIYVVPEAGGTPAKVFDRKGACEPHWSPDGSRIIYETETHIWTIAPDGANNRLMTYFGGVQRYARYSPDGQHIVFCQGLSEAGPWELYIMPAAGGTPQKLTESDSSDMHPDWRKATR